MCWATRVALDYWFSTYLTPRISVIKDNLKDPQNISDPSAKFANFQTLFTETRSVNIILGYNNLFYIS